MGVLFGYLFHKIQIILAFFEFEAYFPPAELSDNYIVSLESLFTTRCYK